MDLVLPITACGIPCRVEVLSYQPATAHGWYEEGDHEDVDWILIDRRGRRAEWLERKLQATPAELGRIHAKVLAACRKHLDDDDDDY